MVDHRLLTPCLLLVGLGSCDWSHRIRGQHPSYVRRALQTGRVHPGQPVARFRRYVTPTHVRRYGRFAEFTLFDDFWDVRRPRKRIRRYYRFVARDGRLVAAYRGFGGCVAASFSLWRPLCRADRARLALARDHHHCLRGSAWSCRRAAERTARDHPCRAACYLFWACQLGDRAACRTLIPCR